MDVGQVEAKLVFLVQGQMTRFKQHRARCAFLVLQGWRFCANHHAAERRIGFFSGIANTRNLATPQHRTSRTQFANFVQLVTDVKQATTLANQFFQNNKQLVNCLWREHRSGFIQNEQLRLCEQSSNDFDALHLAHTQGVHWPRGINVKAVLCRLGIDSRCHLGQGQRCFQAQPHIFGHSESVKQTKVLEHHADAQSASLLGVANLNALALVLNAALIGLDRAVNDFHEGRFARPVFT